MEACGRIEREVRAINGVEHVGWIFLANKLWKTIKEGSPKTQSSKQDIPISRPLRQALQSHGA